LFRLSRTSVSWPPPSPPYAVKSAALGRPARRNPPDRAVRFHPAGHETRCADEGIEDIAAAALTVLD
jgi:hypothetical protein